MIRLSETFKEINHVPSSDLEKRVLKAIRHEEVALLRRKAWIVQGSTLISGFAFLAIIFVQGPAFFQSEFWSLLTLLFSDMSIITSSFGDYLYSLLETLPILPLTLILFALLVVSFSTSLWMSLTENRSKFRFHKPLFSH